LREERDTVSRWEGIAKASSCICETALDIIVRDPDERADITGHMILGET